MKQIFFFCFLIVQFSFAQNATHNGKPAKPIVLTKDQISEIKSAAGSYYKEQNYKMALTLYRQLQAAEPENMEYNYRLGICYLNTNLNKGMAANFLVKASGLKDVPKDVNYHLGRALLYLGEVDDAVDTYEKYKEANSGKVNPKFNLDNQIEWCYHLRDLKKTPVDVKFVNAGKNVNSNTADFRPIIDISGENLYFSSNRKTNTGAIQDGFGEYITDGYASVRDTGFAKAKNLGTNVNGMGYDELLAVNANADRLLIYKEAAGAESPLYIASINGKSWDKAVPVEKLPSNRMDGACMSANGKTIYFAADLKGGLGGKDIWMTIQNEKGEWSSPKNLGDGVNTKFDEANPWLFYDDKTLFFASEGHNSIGGYDIFMSDQGDASQPWSKAINVGYPLNTTDDDKYISLTADGKTGYVSQLRPEGLGETDIYKFTLTAPLVKPNQILVKGVLLKADGTPAKDASALIIKNSTGDNMGVMKANSVTGRITAMLPPGTYKLKVKGLKSGRLDEDFTITGQEKNMVFSKTFKLSPPVKEGK